MEEKSKFSWADGHLESVLIGCGQAKVSYQTWDRRKLVLLFARVESVKEAGSVNCDVGDYTERKLDGGLWEYAFFDADDPDKALISIIAESMQILDAGGLADINAALFDVGRGYIGGQTLNEIN